MYCRALISPQPGARFSETVDLWSLGATLFHAATGQLPFVPFLGGRVAKDVMYEMTSKKPHGSISGRQLSNNGQIIYSDDLPDTCRLSKCAHPVLVAYTVQCTVQYILYLFITRINILLYYSFRQIAQLLYTYYILNC